MMSKKSRREVVEANRGRYLRANRVEKQKILDFIVETTGYNRSYVIRSLRHPRRSKGLKKPGRKRTYQGQVIVVLEQVWEWCDRICSKRLQPYLPQFVNKLEICGALKLTDELRKQLLSMSAATIDRCLKIARFKAPIHGRSTTKPGTLLKNQIPIQVYTPWDEQKPGFLEIDLVAHCGESVAGQFLYSLTTTDIATGWTDCFGLPNKTQQAVNVAIQNLGHRLPFPLLGLDSDNGTEFINDLLFRYCKTEHITFTRCRPYHKNDQSHVEQKNWSVVRKTVGYDRLETPAQLLLLQRLYDVLHLYFNFFQPIQKVIGKKQSKTFTTKIYDQAKTPYQRVLDCKSVSESSKLALISLYNSLNPITLWEEKNLLTAQLLKIAQLH